GRPDPSRRRSRGLASLGLAPRGDRSDRPLSPARAADAGPRGPEVARDADRAGDPPAASGVRVLVDLRDGDDGVHLPRSRGSHAAPPGERDRPAARRGARLRPRRSRAARGSRLVRRDGGDALRAGCPTGASGVAPAPLERRPLPPALPRLLPPGGSLLPAAPA